MNMEKFISALRKYFIVRKYQKVNNKRKLKPYFSKKLYLQYNALNKNDSEQMKIYKQRILHYEKNSDNVWFKKMDGKELIQVGEDRFEIKDKEQYWSLVYFMVSSDSVVWRKFDPEAKPTKPRIVTFSINEKVLTISSGKYHNVVLTEKHTLLAWGSNVYGQLGTGDTQSAYRPVEINIQYRNEKDFPIDVRCGFAHTVILTHQGHVYVAGINEHCELGLDHTQPVTTFQKLDFLNLNPGETITKIRVGYSHNFAMTNEGRIFGWGSNGHQKVGVSFIAITAKPTLLDRFKLDGDEYIDDISAGWDHNLAITNKKRVFSWGNNRYNELGIPDEFNDDEGRPQEVFFRDFIENEFAEKIIAGSSFSIVLTNQNRVFVWGNNSDFQLGFPRLLLTDSAQPLHRYLDKNLFAHSGYKKGEYLIDIHANGPTSIGLTNIGRILLWGPRTIAKGSFFTMMIRLRRLLFPYTPYFLPRFKLDKGDKIAKVLSVYDRDFMITSSGKILTHTNHDLHEVEFDDFK